MWEISQLNITHNVIFVDVNEIILSIKLIGTFDIIMWGYALTDTKIRERTTLASHI